MRRRRDAPRDSSFGLPNLDQKLVLQFSRSDMDKVRTWIERACATVAETTGSQEVTVEQAILFLCEKDMISGARLDRAAGEASHSSEKQQRRAAIDPDRTRPDRLGAAREETAPEVADRRQVAYRAQIVYQRCRECNRARMGTRDGFVEVAPEEIERYAGSADHVAIDGPTPPGLRRRILAREAGRCGNPRCHHRADHCHHIVFRSRGGKTELANEVAICTTCHALIHAGLLRVSGRSDGELRWLPVAGSGSGSGSGSLERDIASESAVAERLPVLQLVEAGEEAEGSPADRSESADADSGVGSGSRNSVNLEDLAGGLVSLGWSATRSRTMIAAAIETLPPNEITEANVLRKALGATGSPA